MLYLISFQPIRPTACFRLPLAVGVMTTVQQPVEGRHGVPQPGFTNLGNGHIVYVKVSFVY